MKTDRTFDSEITTYRKMSNSKLRKMFDSEFKRKILDD